MHFLCGQNRPGFLGEPGRILIRSGARKTTAGERFLLPLVRLYVKREVQL